MRKAPITPQLSYPFDFSEVEQDTLDEIAMACELVLRYPVGYRIELPQFGRPELLFRESTEDIERLLLNAVSRWEPRARLLVEERPDRWTRMVRHFILTVEAPPSA
jgi:phage baseplate assembly protein W